MIMTTNYNYKTGKNNTYYNTNSKKETYAIAQNRASAAENLVEKSLTFIDSMIELLSSFRLLVAAKALFAFIALLGFFGLIGGMELGRVSLFSGVIALALIVGAEFLILKD
jgi:hypothetical protein